MTTNKPATRVFCTFSFEALHCWPDAIPEVAYLASPHRHMFHVRAEVTVTHNDRDIEFILLRQRLMRGVLEKQESSPELVSSWSCEHWANWILTSYSLDQVEVSEDGENGAVVTR